MVRPNILVRVGAVVLGGMLVHAASASAQSGSQALGSVRVTQNVLANGEALKAGTYTLRLSSDVPSVVVGQTPAESRWVEFVQGGKVVGKEMAIVLTRAEIKGVVNEPAPEAGSSKTELLKGGDYLRIWVNHGDTNYLVHLTVVK
jgi:hypothetical protein